LRRFRKKKSFTEGPISRKDESSFSPVSASAAAVLVVLAERRVKKKESETAARVVVGHDLICRQLSWGRRGFFAYDSYEESLVVLEVGKLIQTYFNG
jgi:hypothetical protein